MSKSYSEAEAREIIRQSVLIEEAAKVTCTCLCHSTPGPHARHRCEPQGEPSDAQVEAAARAIADHQGVRYNSSLVDTWDGMARAALRAAGEVR